MDANSVNTGYREKYSNQTYTEGSSGVWKGERGEYCILFMLKYSQGINTINYNITNGKCVQILEHFGSLFSEMSEFGAKV